MAPDTAERRRKLHTTTVRIDRELWERVELHADRLGVANSAFMVAAAREHIARIEGAEAIVKLRFAEHLTSIVLRLSRLEAALRRR